MQHKKRIPKKTAVITSICAIALLGSVGVYSAYTNSQKEETSTEQVQEPLNPTTPKKSTTLSPDSSKDKKKGTMTPKETTNDSSLSDFRSATTSPLAIVQERKQALETLNQQVNQEQQTNQKKQSQAQPQPMVELSKPSEEKPNQNETKPKPIPDENVSPETPTPPVILLDYSFLMELEEQAQAIDLSLYLSFSIGQFELELAVSKRLLEDGASSQEAINNQVARLQQAIDQLVLKGNKATLQATYDHSKTIMTDTYTIESVNALEEAQNEAKTLLSTAEVDQSTIDRVQSNLQQAIDGLKEKEEPELSLTYLNRVVAEANQLNFGDYTPITAQTVKDKVAEINAYIEAGNVTKEDNERFAAELRQSIDQLQKKADTSAIIRLLAEISAIDRTLYTTESLQTLDTAVEQVTLQLANENNTQAEVDALTQQLTTAFDQLELVQPSEDK